MSSQILVVKNSGETEPFSDEKVLRSMQRVGVPKELQDQALVEIKQKLYPEITTREVFSYILDFLKDKDNRSSIKFNLKRAIFNLGPTGFPFEKYIERIFKSEGYQTIVDTTLEGEAVTHEIDLLVEKDGKKEIVEAKFHNHQGIKTDVQVTLYTYARFLDVKEKNNISGAWVVTNTRLTEDAIKYAKNKNIKVIAWNYPNGANLQDMVEKPSLYPITILNHLSLEEKAKLLEADIVLCSELLSLSDSKAKTLFISPERLHQAQEDARVVLEKNGFEAKDSQVKTSVYQSV